MVCTNCGYLWRKLQEGFLRPRRVKMGRQAPPHHVVRNDFHHCMWCPLSFLAISATMPPQLINHARHYAQAHVPAEPPAQEEEAWFPQAHAEERRTQRPEAPQGQGTEAAHHLKTAKGPENGAF